MIFAKPTGGPDVVGGVWFTSHSAPCWNRTGAATAKGQVVQLALTPGEASEIATNDANSYTPGASNDTVYNTVIDPRSSTTIGASIQRGAVFGVVLDTQPVADNAVVNVQFFGVVNEALVVTSGGAVAGDPLTVKASNSNCFDPAIATSEGAYAIFLAQSNTSTSKTLKKILLHNGVLAGRIMAAAIT